MPPPFVTLSFQLVIRMTALMSGSHECLKLITPGIPNATSSSPVILEILFSRRLSRLADQMEHAHERPSVYYDVRTCDVARIV
jgi:hypothetical protein